MDKKIYDLTEEDFGNQIIVTKEDLNKIKDLYQTEFVNILLSGLLTVGDWSEGLDENKYFNI